jgi:hypothetical protein
MSSWANNVDVVVDGPFNGCYGHFDSDAIAQAVADTFITEVAGFIPGPDAGSITGTANGRALLAVVTSDTTKFLLGLEGESLTVDTPTTVTITKGAATAELAFADAQTQVVNGNAYLYWTTLPALVGSELFGTYQLTLVGANEVVVATAQDVIDRVREIVNDNATAFITTLRWSDAELLLWLTDAQREIVKTKPEAYPVTEVFTVAAGIPRQRLDPAVAYRLIRVEANTRGVGESDAIIYGDVIRIVERDVLDAFYPRWTQQVSADITDYYKAYCMDANDPLAFWLSPPAADGMNVWVTYVGVPATVTSVDDGLSLSDIYIAPIVDYMVYRGLVKESREGNREVAERFLRSFYAALGVHRPVLMSIGQNANRPPEAAA